MKPIAERPTTHALAEGILEGSPMLDADAALEMAADGYVAAQFAFYAEAIDREVDDLGGYRESLRRFEMSDDFFEGFDAAVNWLRTSSDAAHKTADRQAELRALRQVRP